jgi:hypothetical protein
METVPVQGMLTLIFRPFQHPFRLRVNDIIRVNGNRLGRIIRVTECAAVVLVNPQAREFKTRFDRPVRFQPSPMTFRISANAGTEILNRKQRRKHRNTQTERRSA